MPRRKQDEKEVSYARKLKKTDGLIDWSEPTLVIERKIRAFYPWPGCYTFMPQRFRKKGNTGRLVILKAQFAVFDKEWAGVAPGTVLKLEKNGPVIKTGDTALLLTFVKPEGSSQMDGSSFLRGRQLVAQEDRFFME